MTIGCARSLTLKSPKPAHRIVFYEISYQRLTNVSLARLEWRHMVDGPINQVQGDSPDPLLQSCTLHKTNSLKEPEQKEIQLTGNATKGEFS